MRRLVLSLALAFAAVAVIGADAAAQGSSPKLTGAWILVPDTGYTGPDLTGLSVTFSTDNVMTIVAPDGTLITKSKVSVAESVITLTDLEGTHMCGAAGKYRITATEKEMRWASVEDGCPDRSMIIGAIKWVRMG